MNTPPILSSLTNPKIKRLKRLIQNPRYRHEEKLVCVVGDDLIKEIAQKFSPEEIFSSNLELFPQATHVTNKIIKTLSPLPSCGSSIALFPKPEHTFSRAFSYILILEKVQDPGNVGTLIRSAYALGWSAVILLSGCADPYSIKSVRSASGATFFLPIFQFSESLLSEKIQELSLPLFIADLTGELLSTHTQTKKAALILGSEGQGVQTKLQGTRLTIPMENEVDSLNVAIAGSIMMYTLGNS